MLRRTAETAAFTSVAVLGMSVAFGLESPNQRTLVIVIAICAGVALASFGEVQFALSGFICQAVGIMFEAARLVRSVRMRVCSVDLAAFKNFSMVRADCMLSADSTGMKMDPLVALYMCARHAAGSAEVSQVRARLRDHQRLPAAVLRGLGALHARAGCARPRRSAVRDPADKTQLTAQHERVLRLCAERRRCGICRVRSPLTRQWSS